MRIWEPDVLPKSPCIPDFASLLLFPQQALPMGKSQCWCDAGAICGLWGLKQRPSTSVCERTRLPRSQRTSRREHTVCSSQGCRNQYGAIPTLLERSVSSSLSLSYSPPRSHLISMRVPSTKEGMNREPGPSISVAKAAIFARIDGALALKPSTAPRGN